MKSIIIKFTHQQRNGILCQFGNLYCFDENSKDKTSDFIPFLPPWENETIRTFISEIGPFSLVKRFFVIEME